MKICLAIWDYIWSNHFKFESSQMYFLAFYFQYIQEKARILRVDIPKTLQLAPRQTRRIISTTLLILIFSFFWRGGGGVKCPFKYSSKSQRENNTGKPGSGLVPTITRWPRTSALHRHPLLHLLGLFALWTLQLNFSLLLHTHKHTPTQTHTHAPGVGRL